MATIEFYFEIHLFGSIVLVNKVYKKINDIWDENLNNFINNDCMIDKLVDKQSGVRFYNIIKSSIPEQWLKTLQNTQVTENNNRKTNTTSNLNKLKIKLRTNSIEPKKLSLKNIQDILRDTEFTPKYKLKWETKFGDNLSWNNIWQNSLLLPVTNKEKQLHWKIIQNSIFTEYRLNLMGRSGGTCHFCKNATRT